MDWDGTLKPGGLLRHIALVLDALVRLTFIGKDYSDVFTSTLTVVSPSYCVCNIHYFAFREV